MTKTPCCCTTIAVRNDNVTPDPNVNDIPCEHLSQLPWVFNRAYVELDGYGARTDVSVFDKECPLCLVFTTLSFSTDELTSELIQKENIYLDE